MLKNYSLALNKARDDFLLFTPGIDNVLILRLRRPVRVLLSLVKTINISRTINRNNNKAEAIGKVLGNVICNKLRRPIKKKVTRLLIKGSSNKSGRHPMKVRSWFTKPKRESITIVYHDASKKHVDIHFSNGTSLIINVSGKPVEKLIRYNNKGKLTQESIKALLKHVKKEINSNSRVPQNFDHTKKEAKTQWLEDRGPNDNKYGAGKSRLVILEDEVEILKVESGDGETVTMYAPCIDPNNSLYIHKLYPSNGKKAPIVIFGTIKKKEPTFLPKPKLKFLKGDEYKKYEDKLDLSTSCHKMDGGAVHLYIDKKGTRLFSPRKSKVTGNRIEYTGKVPSVAKVKSDMTIKAMGELVAYDKSGKILPYNKISGLLNSNSLVPKGIKTCIKLYRIDSWGKSKGMNFSFFENRSMQTQLASMFDDSIDVVELKTIEATKKNGNEGAVVAFKDCNLWKAVKIKWKDEPLDLTIKEVGFKYGPSSTEESPKIAGELICEDSTGKQFKLGSGAMGTRDISLKIMKNPKKYIGRVICCLGVRGGIGRSLQFSHFHEDK